MKKKLLLLFTLLLTITAGVHAQWKTNDQKFAIVDSDSIYGQGLMKSLITPDGYTVLTWTNTPQNMKYSNPKFGYYLHMQVYDPQGNAVFPKGGKIISAQPTMSYTSDYSIALAPNNDVLVAYWDSRDYADKKHVKGYLYRYNLKGEPVWSQDGIPFPTVATHNNNGNVYTPRLCVNDGNIYVGYHHAEQYNVKADSTNWQPNPYIPNDSMPDSVSVGYADFQLDRINADGSWAWAQPMVMKDVVQTGYLTPSLNGNVIVVYGNAQLGIDSRRFDKDGKDTWNGVKTVEAEAVGTNYFPDPTIVDDKQGGCDIIYRKLSGWYVYIVYRHLDSDGAVGDALNLRENLDGDGKDALGAIRNDSLMIAWNWQYGSGDYRAMVNLCGIDEMYLWEDSLQYGVTLDKSTEGIKPVKLIPQSNGWVLLYGNCTSWNGANFMVVKIGNDGKEMWRKQICENDFKSSGFSVQTDGKQAIIFYTCDKEYDDNWNEVPGPGGLRVMAIDITDEGNKEATAIRDIHAATTTTATYYNLNGQRVAASERGLKIVKLANGKTMKVM